MKSRRGFSVAEILVAISLGVLLLACFLLIMQGVAQARRNAERTSDLVINGIQVNSAIRQDVEESGIGAISTPNWSAVAARAGSGPGDDTLVIVRTLAPPVAASTQVCRTAAPLCVRLVGEAPGVAVGSLLVLGSPYTGALVGQVASRSDPYDAVCGADCPGGEQAICADSVLAPLVTPVVTGSVLTPTSGSPTSSAEPCPASVLADGTRCDETTTPQTTGSRTTGVCRESGGQTRRYSEVTLADRTGALGYQSAPFPTLLSGALGLPHVTAQRIEPVRYWVDRTVADHPRLVKQVGVTSAGAWNSPLPVAADIPTFRVEAQLEGDSLWTHTPWVTAGDLSTSPANPNLVRTTVPGAGLPRGLSYRRSEGRVSALRVRYETWARMPNQGSTVRLRMPLAVVVATPGILAGGAVTPGLP